MMYVKPLLNSFLSLPRRAQIQPIQIELYTAIQSAYSGTPGLVAGIGVLLFLLPFGKAPPIATFSKRKCP